MILIAVKLTKMASYTGNMVGKETSIIIIIIIITSKILITIVMIIIISLVCR